MLEFPRESEIIHWIDIATPLGRLLYGGTFVTDQGFGMEEFRSLDFFSFGLLLDGGGRYLDARGHDTRLHPGDCIFVGPGETHKYGCEPGDTWTEVYLCFAGDPFSQWIQSRMMKDRPVLRLGDVGLWAPRWLSIVQSRPRNHSEAVSALAKIHLLVNDVVAADQRDWTFEERLEASKHHLHSWPPNRPPDWRVLAGECQCSYETWRKAFRKHYGISPARFRREALMEQASLLMTRSALSNDQLAEQFGCSDGFHFSKLFKSVKGVSPQEYRQQVRRGFRLEKRRG